MLKGRGSLSLSMIPDDRAVEHGYGELLTRSYGGSDRGRGFLRPVRLVAWVAPQRLNPPERNPAPSARIL